MVKGRRRPGRFVVTTGAIDGELGGNVVGVGCLVVILGMATGTIRRCARVTRSMAIDAGCSRVRTFQGKTGVVVVKTIRPAAGRMTGQASRAVVRIPVDPGMLIIGFRVGMATCTGNH